ncbi:uncharacterized protein LOC101861409 [Aplysia californica]|uniref:Uncharacterized protein LOC101861409 n=1 Tax=Aplysia californica TaxID=6500 RepID=A0ABM0JCD2_APLCA|nr:uncharacterized protein LOC101861409 [Aplysia californica]
MASPDEELMDSESTDVFDKLVVRSPGKFENFEKIDATGKYLPFYGYTIINMVVEQQLHDLELFIKSTQTLKKYVSALPSSSYHVTYYDIFSQRKIPEKYLSRSGLVPSNHWTQSMETLYQDLGKAQTFCSELPAANAFVKKQFSLGPSPGQALLLLITLEGDAEVSQLRQKCTTVFGERGKPEFHMTLGYTYKAIPVDALKLISKELKMLWSIIPDGVQLQKPDVYYFETMEEFLPFKLRLGKI